MGLLSTRLIALAIVGAALCLGGCSTRLDRHWGEAQHAATAMQIAHPDGAQTPEPGTDGVTAEKAMESHRAGDATASAEPTLIQVGTGSND